LMQMCYAFEFLSPEQPTPTRIAEVMARVDRVAADGWACWAFSNHDVVRHTSRWNLSDAAQRMFTTLIMCLRGSVCLYQGEELGLPEAEVAFEDLQDPYGIEFWPEFKGRDGCRTPMVWESDNANGGFSTGKPWLPVSTMHLGLSVAAQEADPTALIHHYRRAIALRHAHSALAKGAHSPIQSAGNVVFFTRTDGAEDLLCVFNVGHEPAEVTLPKGKWTPIAADLGGAQDIAQNNVKLKPWQVCIATRSA